MKLSVSHLQKKFRGEIILKDVSFEAESGEILCIKGRSGSGKTTLLNILVGYLPGDGGEIQPECFVRGYMPCAKVLLDSLTVEENLALKENGAFSPNPELMMWAKHLGIDGLLPKYPHDLSSGEYKRALFCCVLLKHAPVLLLDEPTANLDAVSKKYILDAVQKIKKEHVTIIASHDPAVFEIADAVYDLENE